MKNPKPSCITCEKKCPPAKKIIEHMNNEPWSTAKMLDLLFSVCRGKRMNNQTILRRLKEISFNQEITNQDKMELINAILFIEPRITAFIRSFEK